jgi:hypothetical protein
MKITLPLKTLEKLVPFVSSEEGILIEPHQQGVVMVATDGHKLSAWHETNCLIDGAWPEENVLIDSNRLKPLIVEPILGSTPYITADTENCTVSLVYWGR